ncbi:MAG TPA: hypothetical protein PLO37_25205 [Candidatus Hydrogenedentes bacterium]|nr:hypothetical protein [Candidatus Hydrogenedentota bacterium]HPG70156.1 hypothetical protein [Candidatus Hydrogenedentota bacterium]
MRIRTWSALVILAVAAAALGGCARAALDTTGFAAVNSTTVNAPFDEAWQATKAILREKDYEIYTRDKRGTFVAFTQMKRRFFVAPVRTKHTIYLEGESDDSTCVTVETVRQVYGVTMLTYPGWHDRKTTDNAEAVELLDALQAKFPKA